jgi:hypothetical protein
VDEVIVRIRADADARRCRDETIERFQSSAVIVVKRASLGVRGEAPALDAGRLSGEDDMGRTSEARDAKLSAL